jgi:hypothetical protein
MFHSNWNRLCRQYQKAIEAMRPGFVCTTKMDEECEIINLDDDDEERSVPPPSLSFTSSGSKRGSDPVDAVTPTKRPRLHVVRDGFQSPPGPSMSPAGTPATGRSVKVESPLTTARNRVSVKHKAADFGPFFQPYLKVGCRAMSIMDIAQAIESNSRTGIPESPDYNVKERYALTSVATWDLPLETFLTVTFQMMEDEILSLLQEALREYCHTDLYRQSKQIVRTFLAAKEAEQRLVSMEFFRMEKESLFTINEEAFSRYKIEALEALKTARRMHRVNILYQRKIRAGIKLKVSEEEFKCKITDEQLGIDPYARELDVAAYVRGYYTTARLRFIDVVCANINSKYFGTIKEECQNLLEHHLGLNSGDCKCHSNPP